MGGSTGRINRVVNHCHNGSYIRSDIGRYSQALKGECFDVVDGGTAKIGGGSRKRQKRFRGFRRSIIVFGL